MRKMEVQSYFSEPIEIATSDQQKQKDTEIIS